MHMAASLVDASARLQNEPIREIGMQILIV
jgi:hypothetical protein